MKLTVPLCLLFTCLFLRANPVPGGTEFQQVIDSFGVLQTLAGTGLQGANLEQNDWQPQFEGAAATSVELSNPHMAAADVFGNIYVADKNSHAILKIVPGGTLQTVAGTHVAGFNGDGPAQATTLQLGGPNGLFCRPDGTLYIYDTDNRRIRRMATDGVMTTVIHDTDPFYSLIGRGLWVSADESLIYYSDGAVLKRWTPTGGITVFSTGFHSLANIAMHPESGLLYVCDRGTDIDPTHCGVYRIEANGTATKVAGNGALSGGGDGQLAINTSLDQVRGITFRPNGGYFVCTHEGGDVWYIDTAGIVHLYLQGRGGQDIRLGDGLHPPIQFQCLSEPRSVTLAPNNDLLITTNDSGFLRRVKSVCPPPAPELAAIDRTAESVSLSWIGIPGVSYNIERSESLAAGSWESIGVITSTVAAGEFNDPSTPQALRAFYRITSPQ
ncbi:MAG: hypothetical protein ACR2OZ_04640 [Verrucomicrobiales bacterium]